MQSRTPGATSPHAPLRVLPELSGAREPLLMGFRSGVNGAVAGSCAVSPSKRRASLADAPIYLRERPARRLADLRVAETETQEPEGPELIPLQGRKGLPPG